jgi:hypothetical protein
MKHRVRDEGVAGSNPATPTNHFKGLAFPKKLARQFPRQLFARLEAHHGARTREPEHGFPI